MPIHRPWGRRFKELIAERGESQFEVAEQLGVSQAYVSQFARGVQPSFRLAEKIIQVFELEPQREELMELMGHGPKRVEDEAPEPPSIEDLITRAAAEAAKVAAEEAVRKVLAEPARRPATPAEAAEALLESLEVEPPQSGEGAEALSYEPDLEGAEILSYEGTPLSEHDRRIIAEVLREIRGAQHRRSGRG